jgi:hypothetical protein
VTKTELETVIFPATLTPIAIQHWALVARYVGTKLTNKAILLHAFSAWYSHSALVFRCL